MFDSKHDLALNQQVVIKDECVLREIDGSIDRILDWHETEIYFSCINGIEHVGYRAEWNVFQLRQVGLGEKRLFGEGSRWAEIADATCFRHPFKATSQR